MTAWFIIGPRGAIYRDCWKRHFCAATKAECIRGLCSENAYYSSLDEVWASYKRHGFTCQKRSIVP